MPTFATFRHLVLRATPLALLTLLATLPNCASADADPESEDATASEITSGSAYTTKQGIGLYRVFFCDKSIIGSQDYTVKFVGAADSIKRNENPILDLYKRTWDGRAFTDTWVRVGSRSFSVSRFDSNGTCFAPPGVPGREPSETCYQSVTSYGVSTSSVEQACRNYKSAPLALAVRKDRNIPGPDTLVVKPR